MAEGPPTVVFLAGSGRSGSTLVERLLGGIPGFVNVGELIDIPRRVFAGDERCGCGEPFSACPFWAEVGDRAFGGWTRQVVGEMEALQVSVARQRHMPHHLSPWRTHSFTSYAREYRERYARLYSAIATTAGAQVVVDASKWPAQALALSRGPIDLRVIHVVRDVRGVAWSLSKRDLVRPHATQSREVMFHQGVLSAAGWWAVCQAEVDALRVSGTPVTRIQYERLVTGAVATLTTALDSLGLGVEPEGLRHVGTRSAELGPSHGLSGNPSRFREGLTPLRLDEEWRKKMPRVSQAALGILGLPERVRSRLAEPGQTRLHSIDDRV